MSSDAFFIRKSRPVTAVVEASYIRPANTTAYVAGQVLANSTTAATSLTFANAAREPGLGGIIQGAIMYCSAAPTLKPDVELYLFDTSIGMQNDGVAWSPSNAALKTCLGRIRFSPGLFNVGSANGVVDVDSIGKSFKCLANSKDIYGVCVMRNAYVPTSGNEFLFRLLIIQD